MFWNNVNKLSKTVANIDLKNGCAGVLRLCMSTILSGFGFTASDTYGIVSVQSLIYICVAECLYCPV